MQYLLGRFSVRGKLIAGFGIVLGLTVIMSLLALGQMGNISGQIDLIIDKSVGPMIQANTLESSNKDIGIAIRDIVSLESVSAQREAVKALKAVQKTFQESLAEVKKQDDVAAEEKALQDKIESQYKALVPMIDEVLTTVDESDYDAAKVFVFTKLRPRQAELSASIAQLVQLHVASAKAKASVARDTYNFASAVLGAVVLLALVVGAGVAWAITRSIVGPLQAAFRFASEVAQGDFTQRIRVSGQDEVARLLEALNRMSESLGDTVRQIREEANRTAEYALQLASDAQQAGERSQEQVEQIMAVTSAMEQMSVSIREVSHHADGVNEVAGQARSLSAEGSQRMAHNLGEVHLIVSQVDASGAVISELAEAVEQISVVTNVIKEIADQTNLLALNAAIEAARAGEQGRGFAVVADEVRKLAERTAGSTAEIGQMLDKVKHKAAETVASMGQVRETVEGGSRDSTMVDSTLQQIVDATLQVSNLVADIAAAAQEQSRTTEVTARSIETISGASEETSRTIQRVGDTAAEMNQVSQELQQLVGKFRINS